MNALQIALGLGLAGAMAYTVLGYPHKYGALTGRSRLFRTLGLLVFDLLLLLVLIWTFTDFSKQVGQRVGRIREIFYLASCLVLGLSLPLIALLDALESYTAVRRERREFLQQAVRDEAERAQKAKDKGESGGGERAK
jgi:membrane protease YdiL (CAAX protease family)